MLAQGIAVAADTPTTAITFRAPCSIRSSLGLVTAHHDSSAKPRYAQIAATEKTLSLSDRQTSYRLGVGGRFITAIVPRLGALAGCDPKGFRHPC
jgi:hypothetical protein